MARESKRNSRLDQEFIDAYWRDMRVDHDTGLLQWSGLSEDIGSSYQLPPEARQCMDTQPVLDNMGNPILDANKSPLRRRCPKWALASSYKCIDHHGGAGVAMATARERLLRVADQACGMLADMALDRHLPPAEQLKALNSLLDRVGIRPGLDVSVGPKKWEKVLEGLLADPGEEESAEDA